MGERILVSVPALTSPIGLETVVAAVGKAACARGLAYYRSGAVRRLTVESDDDGVDLRASVLGSAPHPYSVDVYLTQAPAGRRAGAWSADGSCSCPVGINCKHVAAVLFAAGRDGSVGSHGPAAGSDPGARWGGPGTKRGARPLWERLLTPDDRSTEPGGGEPVALLVERGRTRLGTSSLSMRPMVRGRKGGWIRTGISWREVTYAGHRYPARAAALLREIVTLFTAGHSYYYPDSLTIDLAGFPSPRLWAVLAGAKEAGLALVGDSSGTAVVLEAGAVTPEIDVRGGDAGTWRLRPELHLAGHPIAVPVTLIGAPAHGIAYVEENLLGGPDAVGVLHLARLEHPADAILTDLLALSEPLEIPQPDRARFVRDYLPRLRRLAPVTSSDGSAELPGPPSVRLRMTVRRDEVGMVVASWQWRYLFDDEAIDIPLGLPSAAELRDTDAETSLAAAGLDAARALPPLYRRGAFGDELLPEAILPRSAALRLDRDVLPALRATDGIDIEVDDGALDFREATSAPVVAMAGSLTPDKDWLDLTVSVTVDGETVPFIDLFRALAARETVLILPSGTYFPLTTPELDRLRVLIEESYRIGDRDPLRPDTLRVGRYEATYWDELAAMGVLDEQALAWSASVRSLAHLAEIPHYDVPTALTATLRPYQRAGYEWLTFLAEHRIGGVLADDMGLGKTLQTLAMIVHERSENPDAPPFLVVAPTSVVPGWADEAARFAPGLAVTTITATRARRGTALATACAGVDLVVTSYALFRLEYDDYEAIEFSALLLDEAQQIKNHLSKGYRCARKLPAPVKLVITGTPMENNLMELWSMFSIAAPGLLGDPKRFTEHYRGPIEKNQDADRLATLRRRIRPLLLRRTKSEVVGDLPPKTEQVLELELVAGHRRVYQRYLQRERRKVLGLLGEMDRNRFQIFRSLTLLRQAALDAALVDDENAAVPSTKLDALVELVAGAAAEGHRVLVFSQFTRFLGRARERLHATGIATCYLDGATTRRAEVLREFRTGAAPAFLISLKAGGVGLNLTEADYCVITDPWWNPATEQQAVDRAHRIGQDRPVMVYRLVAADTIEEKVMALKERKAALFSSIMTDGGVGAAGLTADDIRGLLG